MVWSLFGTVGSMTQAQFFDKGGNRTADDLRGFRQKDFDAFAQDTFKVFSNLTLNYALRYQFNVVPYEVNNLLSTLFADPSEHAPITAVVQPRAGDRTSLLDAIHRTPYSQVWSFGLRRALPGSVLMELNCVGSKGARLLRLVDGKPPQPALVAHLLADGVPPQALQ